MPDSSQTSSRRTIALAFALAALAQVFRTQQLFPLAAFLFSLSAILTLRRIFAATPEPPEKAPMAPEGAPDRRLGWILALAGGIGGLVCSVLLSRGFARHLFQVMVAGPLSLAALALGADRIYGRVRRPPRAREAIWPLLLILAVGALFRFGSIGWFPPPDGFSSIEEMQRASGGVGILNGQRPWEFPLAQYLDAASFLLFDRTLFAVRLPAMLLGWLTLPVFYLLAREIVARPGALFATALLAVSRWHCQVSWYNEDVYVPLLPFTLLLYLLLRTRRDPRPWLYVAAGALCGYMLYDYAAFRSAPFVVAGFFAAEALRQRRWPSDGRAIALLFGVVALFALPLPFILGGARGSDFYFEALQRSFDDRGYYSSDPGTFVRRHIRRLEMASDVFTTSDHAEFFATLNLPREPLLDPITSVFFVLGFGTTLLLWRRRGRAFVGFGFVVLAAGAMILPWNLDFRRLAILVPFVFLFAGWLAHDVDTEARREGWQRLWHGLLVALAVAAAGANAWFLFTRLAPDHGVRASHRTPYTVALSYLRSHYDGEFVVALSPEMPNLFEVNDYEWFKPTGLHGRMVTSVDELLDPKIGSSLRGRTLFLIARPFDIATVMSQVREAHPGATCELLVDPDDSRHDLGVCRYQNRRRRRP